MWKLREQRLVGVVVSCGAALALVAACSSDSTSGDSGTGGSGNSSGTSSGGKTGSGGATTGGTSSSSGGRSSGGASSGGTSSGGTSSGGTSSGGTSSGGTSSGGGGAANGGGGSSAGGAANGGGGATNGGGAGTAGSGGATGGAAGAGQAGAGEAGAGDAGAPGFTPIQIPLLNSDFEHGDNFKPGTVQDWQTSGDLASYITYGDASSAHGGTGRLAMWRQTPDYKVSTFQTVTGLTNGTYTFAAWVQGAATGINSLYIYATGYSSTATDQVKTDIVPGPAAYAQYSLTNIQVTTGTVTVGVYTDATANTWVNVDDVTLFRVE